jgi:hypothetical protein
MIKEERKKYPSELNTKSIACRIPIGDYVEILNECASKGITVNDWLLMKLYSDKSKSISGNKSEEYDNDGQEFPEFSIQTPRGEYTFQDIDDVENTINHLIKENFDLARKVIESSKIDLNDISKRNSILLSIIDRINEMEWETTNDKISCRKDFKSMWRELFD